MTEGKISYSTVAYRGGENRIAVVGCDIEESIQCTIYSFLKLHYVEYPPENNRLQRKTYSVMISYIYTCVYCKFLLFFSKPPEGHSARINDCSFGARDHMPTSRSTTAIFHRGDEYK